jgi:hypothetical protein
MVDVAAEEAAILEEYRTQCLIGQHPLEDIFSISTESGAEAVVRRCILCGAVVVDREVDDRPMGRFVTMLFPKSNRLLRALLAASVT